MEYKRWVTVVPIEQYEWIKETAKETGVKGGHILREIIERAMKGNAKEFKSSLAKSRWEIELQVLEDKKAELAEKEAELKRKMRNGAVAV